MERMPGYMIFLSNQKEWSNLYFIDKNNSYHTEIGGFMFIKHLFNSKLNGMLAYYIFQVPCNLCLLDFELILSENKELKIILYYENNQKYDNNWLFDHRYTLIKGNLFKNCLNKKKPDSFSSCITIERNLVFKNEHQIFKKRIIFKHISLSSIKDLESLN